MRWHHININQLDKIVNISHYTTRSLPSFICVAFVFVYVLLLVMSSLLITQFKHKVAS